MAHGPAGHLLLPLYPCDPLMAVLYGPDTFTATDGTAALARPPWTVNSGTWTVSSNRMTQTEAFGARLIRYSDAISGDQWIEVDITALDSLAEVSVRYTNTNNDPQVDGAHRVYVALDGSLSLYGTAFLGSAGALALPFTLRLEAQGESIRVFRNGTSVISVTDTGCRLTGAPALSLQPDATPTNTWDNVSVGNFGGPGVPQLLVPIVATPRGRMGG